MLTIKGSVGELRGFCEDHPFKFGIYNMKIRGSGLPKMFGTECGDLIEAMANDGLDYVCDSLAEFEKEGGRLMLCTTDTATKTSVAVLRTSGGDTFMGVAYCHKRDVFNALLGEALAVGRAVDEYFADRGLESDCELAILDVM